jgi:hypothetical protein
MTFVFPTAEQRAQIAARCAELTAEDEATRLTLRAEQSASIKSATRLQRWQDLSPASQIEMERRARERLDADEAEWKASGAPDELAGDLLTRWQVRREALRTAAKAELEVIERAERVACMSASSTDDQVAAAETLAAEQRDQWRRRYRYLWPVNEVRKAAAVTLIQNATAAFPMPSNQPQPLPMIAGQATVAEIGRPVVEGFLTTRSGRPATDTPLIPDAASGHALFESLNAAIPHIVEAAERSPKSFRTAEYADVLAVLSAVHNETFKAVCARIQKLGAPLAESKLSAAVQRFESRVSRELRTGQGWITDTKGLPDAANSDNVAVLLNTLGVDVRHNGWTNRDEVRGLRGDEWFPLDERALDSLLTTAANSQHQFRPREAMFRRAVSALAHETVFDPVLSKLAEAQAAWDGKPRLDSLLVKVCGVPHDAYHCSVARNLVGGIVKRARRPGCKHDEVVIFIGGQGIFKSTMLRVLSLDDRWFTDSVDFSGSPQNVIPQTFGRLVIELSELDALEKRDLNHVKRFLSTQTDSVTLKYDRLTSDMPRRSVFVGTTNESNPLRDTTGNRRFLPVRVERIDIEWLRANVEQIFGEAATLEAAGDNFLIPNEVLGEARARQEMARAEADFEVYLHGWIKDAPDGTYVRSADIQTALRDAVGRSIVGKAYGPVMKRLGFLDGSTAHAGRVWYKGQREAATRAYVLNRDGLGQTSLTLPLIVAPPTPMRGNGTA